MKNNVPTSQNERQLEAGKPIVTKTDTRGVITYVNDAFLKISGFTRKELIGESHKARPHGCRLMAVLLPWPCPIARPVVHRLGCALGGPIAGTGKIIGKTWRFINVDVAQLKRGDELHE